MYYVYFVFFILEVFYFDFNGITFWISYVHICMYIQFEEKLPQSFNNKNKWNLPKKSS